MKYGSCILVVLVLVLVFGLAFVSCDDGSSNGGGGTQGGGNTNVPSWPDEFIYGGRNNWYTTLDSGDYFNFTFNRGTAGSGLTLNNELRLQLISVEGKKFTVRVTQTDWPNITPVGTTYIFRTDYTIFGDTITLIGGTIPRSRLGSTITKGNHPR